jgi:hypothetical protein
VEAVKAATTRKTTELVNLTERDQEMLEAFAAQKRLLRNQ